MYSIGEFSKIGSVSTKTLRYYDEIGLLRPAHVDELTHYRYYTEEQVDTILLISELKTYDLRLEQIRAILESDNSSLLEHFLQERVQALNDSIQQNIQLRRFIERKIHEIQSGGTFMSGRTELIVETKEFAPIWVMSKTAAIDISQLGTVIGGVFEEIFKNHLAPAGPVMTFYHDEEFHQENANIEVCVPVAPGFGAAGFGAAGFGAFNPANGADAANASAIAEKLANIPGVKLLSPGLCATCTHVGPYSQLGKAYAAVLKWIEENGCRISSAPFDVYENSPQAVKDPDELITQVWFPITK